MAKVLCVLYDDPVDGYPTSYARDGVPEDRRAIRAGRRCRRRARSTSRPASCSAASRASWGCASSSKAAGTRSSSRPTRTATDSVFERELPDAEVVISQPFWPAYLTAERIAKAPKLKLAITAGIGSDHVDLQAAMRARHHRRGGDVLEQHQRERARRDDDPVARAQLHPVVPDGGQRAAGTSRTASRARTTSKACTVGTVAAGRIGTAVLRRLKPFDVKLHYTDRHRLPAEVEQELGLTFHPDAESMVRVCDVVTINAPLHPETEHMFNDALIGEDEARRLPREHGARQDLRPRRVVRALESGQLAGYAGDVWFPQPAPKDHPWRTMPHHGMTPHVSGTSLSAQARYAAGTREILECWFDGRPIRDEYLIVDRGKLAGAGAHSYSAGNATAGSEEAERFKSNA